MQAVDAVATWTDTDGALFLVNRHETDTIAISCEVPEGLTLTEAVALHHSDPLWQASPEDDTTVAPRALDTAALTGTTLTLDLPPTSWAMVRLAR